MRSEHRAPLVASIIVVLACIGVMAHAVRTEALGGIARRTPMGFIAGAVLQPRPEPVGDAPRPQAAGAALAAQGGQADPTDGASGTGTSPSAGAQEHPAAHGRGSDHGTVQSGARDDGAAHTSVRPVAADDQADAPQPVATQPPVAAAPTPAPTSSSTPTRPYSHHHTYTPPTSATPDPTPAPVPATGPTRPGRGHGWGQGPGYGHGDSSKSSLGHSIVSALTSVGQSLHGKQDHGHGSYGDDSSADDHGRDHGWGGRGHDRSDDTRGHVGHVGHGGWR